MASRANSNVSRPSRLRAIANTLLGIRKGSKPTPEQQSELDWFTRVARLDRPIEQYAPRTQRRYLAGAAQGQDAVQTRARERTQQQSHVAAHAPYSPSQWRKVQSLARKIKALGVDVEPYQDNNALQDFGTIYGPEYVIQILTEQIESTEAALRGDYTVGRMRWDAHERFDQLFRASSFYYPQGSDPYFYYHGRR